jgi:peptidoglycan/LPS O-acetylase OafA/YrhL
MATNVPQTVHWNPPAPGATPAVATGRRAAARPGRGVASRRAPGTPWRVVVAVGVALLVLALGVVRVEAAPRLRLDGSGAGTAGALGRGATAGAVTALVTAPAGQDPLIGVPADFSKVMGYTPVPLRMADGTLRLAKPTGACSAPGGGTAFGFQQACKVHDYGYDLLRYAHAAGQQLTTEARRQLDGMLGHDLRAQCDATRHGLAGLGCHALAEAFVSGACFNSWRQHQGNPGRESAPWWALGLALPALATPLAPRLRRRFGASAGGSRPGLCRLRALAQATPPGRDRYVDFLRVVSIVTVVLGHWTMIAVGRSAHGLVAGNVLSRTPWLWLATWVLQVMPVFFVVGGFSNMASWQARERRGGGYVEYLSARIARLLRPVLVFASVWLLLPPLLGLLGVPAGQVQALGKVMGQPLWFLGTYLVVVALAPPMVRLHRRFRLRVPTLLAAAVAAVDALRLVTGVEQVGYLNLLTVWTLVQQVGFFYADGSLQRLSRRALAGLGAAGLACLVALTGTGLYPASMVGLPGEQSNMNPPTICIVALTVWQVALVMLARRRVSAWLARPRPWTAVIAVGSMAMTIYLWHLTAMVLVLGLVLVTHGPLPTPGGALWWATRPLWLAVLATVLAPMALLLARFERPARRPRSPHPVETGAGHPAPHLHPAESATARLAVVLGVGLAAFGLLGFVATGFAPLLGGGGGPLAALHLDPLQNLLHLLIGAKLAGAARSGAATRPLPWLLAATGSALPLVLPSAHLVTVIPHLAVTALALTVAASSHRHRSPVRPAMRYNSLQGPSSS